MIVNVTNRKGGVEPICRSTIDIAVDEEPRTNVQQTWYIRRGIKKNRAIVNHGQGAPVL